MKNKLKLIGICQLLLMIGMVAHAQGTAFTYQGRLNAGGAPAGGSYTLVFTLYTTNTTGSAVAGPVTNTAVAVTNGLFTTTIDFGAGVFLGSSNWLEIAVSTNGANAFSTLAPRQQLTPVPYAITAANVSGTVYASSVSGALTNGNLPSSPTVTGTVTAGAFAGNGANVTNVNAAALNGLSATNFWQLGGNNVAGGQFLGSANSQAVIVKVNNQEAMRYEPTTDTPNVVGGYSGNYVQPGLPGVTIGGGGTAIGGQPNIVTNNGQYAVIAGGYRNTVTNYGGAILGGSVNFAGGYFATIGGGQVHTNFSDYGFIGGGILNTIQRYASYSMIGGGNQNTIQINSSGSTIGGGYQNYIGPNATNSTIGGGQQIFIGPNAFGSTIGGGYHNLIQANATTSMIGGGSYNYIYGNGGFIGGGGYDGYAYAGNNNYGNAAVIVGGLGNSIASGGDYSVIGGGYGNTIQFEDSTIGGGVQNNVSGIGSFIGGGGEDGGFNILGNTNAGNASVIVGGLGNLIASGVNYSTIGGGVNNVVGGTGGTVPGGNGNTANGANSFAAGTYAHANNDGAFVWADLNYAAFNSTGPNQFLIRAAGNVGINTTTPRATLHVANGSSGQVPNGGSVGAFESSGSAYINLLTPSANESGILFGNTISAADGGILYNSGSITRGLQFRTGNNATRMVITSAGNVGIGTTSPGNLLVVGNSGSPAYCNGTTWQNGSDRNIKNDFSEISPQTVLAKVSALPITEWQYKLEAAGTRHIGPMAQDFHAAFGLNGGDDTHISTVDEGGVALAAIQGLNEKMENRSQKAEDSIQKLQMETKEKDAEIQELKQRLDALEKLILNQKQN